MQVVSDTSPIVALAYLELLPLLDALFDQVLIPPAVLRELESPAAGLSPVDLSRTAKLEVRVPSDREMVARLRRQLHSGESEAIALAMEIDVPVILMDEMKGRTLAQRHGLRPFGVLGLLVRAKSNGKIDLVEPYLDRLEHELEFYMSKSLRNGILRMAGE